MITKDLPYLDKLNKWSSHSQMAKYLSTFPAGTKVLDIGTATGTLGRMCQNMGLIFYGIEPNQQWAETASPFYQEIKTVSLEACPKQFLSQNQVIVMGDVLEHLASPQDSMKYLLALQTQECCFIISVPNIANIWIRLNLLFGRFDYTENGILDHTHLHFFTQKSLLHMISCLGLEVLSTSVTPIPLEKLSSFFELSPVGRIIYHLLYLLTNLFPTLFAYQFLVKVRKANHE